MCPGARRTWGETLPRWIVPFRLGGCPASPVGLGSYARPCRGTAPRGATRPPLPRPRGSGDRGDRSSTGTRRSNHQDVSLRSDQAITHARSRRAAGECVAAAGRPPRRGTARATPTRIADAAIPGRSRRNGPGNGFAKRCAHGDRATALRRPRMTGRARTRAGAAANRSNDYRPENGPRRPPSSICTAAGRAPSRTPSAAPERLGVHAADIRTRARAPARDRERRRSPRNASVPVASLRRGAERATGRLSAAADCGEGTIRGSPGGHGHAVDATAATVGRLSEYRCCLPGLRHFRDGSRFRWV